MGFGSANSIGNCSHLFLVLELRYSIRKYKTMGCNISVSVRLKPHADRGSRHKPTIGRPQVATRMNATHWHEVSCTHPYRKQILSLLEQASYTSMRFQPHGKPTMNIRPTTPAERSKIRAFIADHWGEPRVVGHGTEYYPETLPAFVAEDEKGEWVGLLTYSIEGDACEVVTIDSLHEGQGIGAELIATVAEQAKIAGCRRLWLITTNDNLNALRFYQKRGFELVAVHRRAVERARQIKPTIPAIGAFGIPLRDELELEMPL
jgi:GNAT superfamily N-acetyltransferase